MSKRYPHLSRFLIGLLATTCVSCADSPEFACAPMIDGVTIVGGGGPSDWIGEVEPSALVELWRRGGSNEGEELAFPIFPSASLAGRLAIPDFQLSEVIVLESDGTWLGPWARPGPGPGELATPVAATWGSDESLAVLDIVNSKVLYLRDGQSSDPDVAVDPRITSPIVSSGELIWAGVQPNGAVLLHPAWHLTEDSPEDARAIAEIIRLATHENRPDTLTRSVFPTVSGERLRNWPAPDWPRPTAAVGAGGVVALGATDGSYGILVLDSSGAPIHQICRASQGNRRSAIDVASPPTGFEGMEATLREAPRPPRPAAFDRILVGARGRIWVQRDRSNPYPGTLEPLRGKPGALHDVFGPEGSFLGSVRMPLNAALQAARGDTIWTFMTGELDEVWVVAYAISA